MAKVNLIKKVEKFWDDQPCNIRHSDKKMGTIEFFDEIEKKKFFVEPHIIEFTDFPIWGNKSVLEIGCGLGTTGINFVKYGANYTGIDLSKNSINLAKKRFEINEQSGSFYHGNAEELTSFVPIKVFDLIYSFGVIHHTPHPEKVISEITNYMNIDSVLKIMLYAKKSWKNYMINAGFDSPEAQFGCPIAKTYTERDVEVLLKEFDIISIDQDHIFPYQIELYKKGIYKKQPWFKVMPEAMFKALEKNIGWHLLITAKLRC